ncbi:MAG TPA: hypothetical protein VEA59_05855 [Patescibacteria group bacterium]|nr:hypothetical protein [Patescibacteria group bacterium]
MQIEFSLRTLFLGTGTALSIVGGLLLLFEGKVLCLTVGLSFVLGSLASRLLAKSL